MLLDLKELIEEFNLEIEGILHIGAHIGEEGPLYQSLNIRRVIWLEPILESFNKLLNQILHYYGHVAIPVAAYHEDEAVLEMHIASNGESSSLLEFEEHLNEHPKVKMVGTTQVTGIRVDTLMDRWGFDPTKFNFVNIDIQGSELCALRGMTGVLHHFNYLYLEVNEKHLYKNCCLVGELDEFLADYDFHRVKTKMTKHGWGDALYIRGEMKND